MTTEELKAIVKEAIKEAQTEHPCFLTPDEKAVVHDIADAGVLVNKVIRRTVIGGMAAAIIWLIIKGVIITKGALGL